MIEECLRVVQVTDCHLFKTPEGKLLGMNTQESLDAVLALIREEHKGRFDCFLATGDLSQDGSVESYQRLKSDLEHFNKPQYWIPGNHDHRANMESVIGQDAMPSLIQFEHWQIVLLDSQVPGKVHGNLTDNQLAVLEKALQTPPHKHTLVCMHHQPWPMGSQWLDTQKIRSLEKFNEIISQSNHVQAVLWGHVHQASEAEHHGAQYISTPSTCVQFEPHSEDFSVDTLSPGYRWLELYPDGTLKTSVSRVEDIEFEIDWSIKGY